MRPLEPCWGGEGKGGGGPSQHLPGPHLWLVQGEGGRHVGEGRGRGGGGQRQHLPGPHLWLVQGEGGRHVGEGRGRGAGGSVNTYLVLTCGWCKVREGDMLGRGGEERRRGEGGNVNTYLVFTSG